MPSGERETPISNGKNGHRGESHTTFRGITEWRRLMKWLVCRWSFLLLLPSVPRYEYNKSELTISRPSRWWWAPIFLRLSRSPPPFSSRFKFHSLLPPCVQHIHIYRIFDVVVGISSAKGNKRRTIGYSFFFFLSTEHWFHFCWHGKISTRR